LVGHLLAAGAEHFRGFEFLDGEGALAIHIQALVFEKAESEEIENDKARQSEEEDEFFFAGLHGGWLRGNVEDGALTLECRGGRVLSVAVGEIRAGIPARKLRR
jgi:hypothetical protein